MLAMLVLAVASITAKADSVYLPPAEFVAGAFVGAAPQMRVLWLTSDIHAAAAHILGHEPAQLRQKYWTDGRRTAWILDEIGKEEPITVGFIINDNRIEQARVLIYRESRGSEIRYPSFVAQFQGATLTTEGLLNRHIDGIAGATLSVRALNRLARLALLLHQQAMHTEPK